MTMSCITDKIELELMVRYLCDELEVEHSIGFSNKPDRLEREIVWRSRNEPTKTFYVKEVTQPSYRLANDPSVKHYDKLFYLMQQEKLKNYPLLKEVALCIVKNIRGELFYTGRRPTIIAAAIVYVSTFYMPFPVYLTQTDLVARIKNDSRYQYFHSSYSLYCLHQSSLVTELS